MTQSIKNCPICGTEAQVRCRCPRGHARCANGHSWRFCLAHAELRVVVGEANHSRPTLECSCSPEQLRQDEALRLAAVLEDDSQ